MSKRPADEETAHVEMKRKYPDNPELVNKPSTSSQEHQGIKVYSETAEKNTVQEGMKDLPTSTTSTIEIPSRDWQIDRNLQSCLLNMYENDRWTDMTIICGDGARPLKAHKLILASRSPVFEAMLFGPCSEPKNEYNFPDVDTDIFDMMLRYIYTDKAELKTEEDAMILIQMGDMYQMRTLVNHCASFLESKINIENVWVNLDCALRYDISSLRDRCCDYIDENAVLALYRPEFKTVSFEVLSYVLKGDTLYAGEEIIFSRVVNWATLRLSKLGKETNGKNIRDILGDAFYHNRLTTLGAHRIMKLIEGKGFFTTTEDKEIVNFTENKISRLSFLSNERRVSLHETLKISCCGFKYLYEDKITQTYDLLVSNDVYIESIAIPYIPVYFQILYADEKLAIVDSNHEFVERIRNKQSLPQGLQQLSVSITIDEKNFKQHFVIHQNEQTNIQKLDHPLLLEKESSPMKLKVEVRPIGSGEPMKIMYGSMSRDLNNRTERLAIKPIQQGNFVLEKVGFRNCSYRENEKPKSA